MNKTNKFFSIKYPQDIKLKIKVVLIYFIAMLAIFSGFRFLLCFSYPSIFSELSFLDKLLSFAQGLRFDIATLSLFLGGFIILLFSPYPKSSWFIKLCITCLSISSFVMLIILSADFFYFPEVKRHMTEELILAWRDKSFIVGHILKHYLWILILICTLSIYLTRKILKFIDKNYNPKAINLLKGITVLLLVVILVIFARRSRFDFKGRPLNISHITRVRTVHLTLNGVFIQYYFIKEKGVIKNKYPKEEAFKNAAKILLSDNEILSDEKFSLMRQISNVDNKIPSYNIVVLLLESWTPKYIDSLNGNKKYNVTPNFDEIADNGIKFVNGYATGTRSQFGLISTLAGLEIVPGMVHSYGFDTTTKFTSIAQAFKRRGYFTMYAQSTDRSSISMCSISKNVLGFNESYGKEDFPKLMDYKYKTTYDYDMLDFVSKKAEGHHKKGQPFFIYAFTGTTHVPFISTTKQFEKYPPTSEENKFLNSLYYADYAIGHLIDNAKKDGWFDNTVFIFMADHIAGFTSTNDTKQRFKIPFVVYAPKIFKHQVVDYTVSQADLMPSLFHLMNIKEPFTAVGVNIFDKNANHFALLCDGMNIVFVDKDGNYISSNRDVVVESSFEKEDERYQEVNDILLSLDKSITESVKDNKWYNVISRLRVD
ncbi:MAG: sulfatase-like hydrolase/transferase [Endomicrobium sp.]|jgi:phosphoglycerol transferase MdoB-like AlkP superfamily enzyme|nr:sulfatase-like hydrolase/transferase [Endomicrobium sp.]